MIAIRALVRSRSFWANSHCPSAGPVHPATPVAYPFGIWFANENTLYICDEGDGTLVSPAVDGNVADATTLATAGVQKWSRVNGKWQMDYVLQND
jgi:hypothetical protein